MILLSSSGVGSSPLRTRRSLSMMMRLKYVQQVAGCGLPVRFWRLINKEFLCLMLQNFYFNKSKIGSSVTVAGPLKYTEGLRKIYQGNIDVNFELKTICLESLNSNKKCVILFLIELL